MSFTNWRLVLLTIVFYTFSISLTFFNNRCIQVSVKQFHRRLLKHFPFPLSITLLHACFKFCTAWLIRSIGGSKLSCDLAWPAYATTVSITGVSTGLDIGFSNWSFEFITVSLYTMTKSSSIIFILLFSFLFGLEQVNAILISVVLLIASGLFFFSYDSVQFDATGFYLVLLASAIGGLRWSSAQLMTQKRSVKPIDLIYHTQPWMALTILPLSVYVEGMELATSKSFFRSDSLLALSINLAYLSVGAVLAFGLELSEYYLVKQASSLTLSIASILKEVVIIYLATTYQGDRLSQTNLFGFVVCLVGITLHAVSKLRSGKC